MKKMDVTSFDIDHNRLLRGIYVSRKDTVGDGILTTFDVRMKEPNREMVMDTSVIYYAKCCIHRPSGRLRLRHHDFCQP